MKTILYIIRHARSEANDSDLLGGITNYHLSENGKIQADELVDRLSGIKIDAIYSSPLIRAIETITPTARKLWMDIKIENDLKEINVGSWENIMWKQLREKYPHITKKIDETEYYNNIDGQELTEDIANRMFSSIKKISEENIGKNIILVSHLVAIRAFLCKIKNIPYEETKQKIGNVPNASITTIEYDYGLKIFEVKTIGEYK